MPRRSQGLQPGHSGTSRSRPSPVTELLGMRTFGMILVLPARSATSVRHAASCSHGESVPPPCPPARFCAPPLPPVAAGLTADPAADWPGGDREPARALPSPACSARSARGLRRSAPRPVGGNPREPWLRHPASVSATVSAMSMRHHLETETEPTTLVARGPGLAEGGGGRRQEPASGTGRPWHLQ